MWSRIRWTYPGGRLCLYMHLSPPFGQVQNQPYLPFSTASTKNLHTLSVVVLGFPCLLRTTCRSFSVPPVSCRSSLLHRIQSVVANKTHLHPNQPYHLSSSHPPHPLCPSYQYISFLLPLPLHTQIMTEFTFLPFVTIALLIEYTYNRLRIHPERYLLHLHRLEKLCHFSFGNFSCSLFLLPLFFFGCCALLFGSFGVFGLRLNDSDLLFGGATLFL